MYGTVPCPGKILYSALKSLGETEWTGGTLVMQKDDDWKCPPVIAWRYKDKDERRDQLIVDAVESFNGNLQWIITFRDRESLPGRNWSIMPRRFKEFLNELKKNPGLIDPDLFISSERAFSKIEPEIGEIANQEIPQLAEYIKNYVQKELSVISSF
jgi:hypothetical protein